MSSVEPSVNQTLADDFDSDSGFNSSIKSILVQAGYLSFEFLPPVDDEAWDSEMSKVLTDPMIIYVQNRIRRRNERLECKCNLPSVFIDRAICCCAAPF